MARRKTWTLRKCVASACTIFCISVFLLFLILQSIQDDDFYSAYDPVGIHQDFLFSNDVDYGGNLLSKDGTDRHDRDRVNVTGMNIKVPIVLWWTAFTGERGKVKTCGTDKCFFTVDRHFQNHPKTQVFMFYGTDFMPRDLPLPRRQNHEWALLHEESPKNNYILTHEECVTLFNHTATYKRDSDFPITTQYLENLSQLTSTKYLVPTAKKSTGGLAPVVYIHSDCNPPSDRDSYAAELMKHISVDSYGKCLHNKDLPSHLANPLTMNNKELYKILARYKFNLAFENAICDDYITEKLWRPLALGSVPVYRGSPKVRDWLPDNRSAVIADDFSSPQELAAYLKYLVSNPQEYEKFLEFKKSGVANQNLVKIMKEREWAVNDYNRPNFIDAFECFVCRRVHTNHKRAAVSLPLKNFIAKKTHYDCPRPRTHDGKEQRDTMLIYWQMYDEDKRKAKALRKIVERGKEFSPMEFQSLMSRYKSG